MLFHFLFTMNANPGIQLYVFANGCRRLYHFQLICLYCYSPWLYILNVLTQSHDNADLFSNAVQVFRNLFWKMCPLFGQILITCLKCSRAFFAPSCYSEKMRWGQRCTKELDTVDKVKWKNFLHLMQVFLSTISFNVYFL